MHRLLDVESYLQKYYKADERVRQAELDAATTDEAREEEDVRAKIAFRDRVLQFRDNQRMRLHNYGVPSPSFPSTRWLLYKAEVVVSTSDNSLSCQLCRKCSEALAKTTAKGIPDAKISYEALARGLWQGEEPDEIKILSWQERRILRLGRTYASVKRVLVNAMPGRISYLDATPQYTTRNVVSFPQDLDTALQVICLMPEDLPKDIHVQFEGSDSTVLHNEPALLVDVAHLRNAFWWYLGHNWQWLEATKDKDVMRIIDELVAAYRKSLRGCDRGVPDTILETATPISAEDATVTLPGPADTAEASTSDSDGAASKEHTQPRVQSKTCVHPSKTWDTSAVVFDGGSTSIGPAQLLHRAMEQYGILERAARDYAGAVDGADEDAQKRAVCEEAEAVAAAVHAIRALNASETRKKLADYHNFIEGAPPTVRIGHTRTPLNSFSPDWWVLSFTDLFFAGDFTPQPGLHGRLRRWAKLLLQRVDYLGWAASKEFAAAAMNISVRRAQMWNVSRYINTSVHFQRSYRDLAALSPHDFVASALAAGDCHSIRAALRKKGVVYKVKEVLRCINFALQEVEGSESERELFRLKFGAMRVWNGCTFLFFTLNPHDTKTPLLIAFLSDRHTAIERLSLDWDDETMAAYYERIRKGNAHRLHQLVCQWPAAGAACVHWAFRKVTEILFRCAPAANAKPRKQHIHTHPALCGMPGIASYVAGSLGVVEPQMRLREHKHELIQLMGYSNPRDFFGRGQLLDRMREMFAFVATLSFTSVEAYAAQCGTGAGMRALQETSLMPVRKGQQEKLGADRASECLRAQCEARGLSSQAHAIAHHRAPFVSWTSAYHGDRTLSASAYEQRQCLEINAGSIQCGNHSCLPATCYKGRIGRAGFCRMKYFHYRFVLKRLKKSETTTQVAKRCHGKALQARWMRKGAPPVIPTAPQKGAPGLERNHPFFFNMNPGVLSGPRCNHDMGVLPKLPVLSAPLQEKLLLEEAKGNGSQDAWDSDTRGAVDDMMDTLVQDMVNSEYYTSDYASKEQPQAANLLHTLHDACEVHGRDAAERHATGDCNDVRDQARRLLQSLVSATNRRVHTGMPTVTAYLLGKPSHYCSHQFERFNIHSQFGRFKVAARELLTGMGSDSIPDWLTQSTSVPPATTTHKISDYNFRPEVMEMFPLYFFISGTRLVQNLGNNTWEWSALSNGQDREVDGSVSRIKTWSLHASGHEASADSLAFL